MNCLYCFSDIADEAVVCKVCKRDLYLFKPLQTRILELEAQLLEARNNQTACAEVAIDGSVDLINQHDDKNTNRGFKNACVDVVVYLCVPFLMLLIAHGIITIVYDTKMIYLRVISIIIPFLFGYLLFQERYRTLWPWLIGVIFLSMASVLGMSGLTSLVDGSPILPQGMFEWREFLEYAVSIFFSFLTGILLGMTVYAKKHPSRSERASPLVKMILRLSGAGGRSPMANQSALKIIETYGGALATILSTVFAIYTGLKRFL